MSLTIRVPESVVQTKIIKRLESAGWYVIKLIKTNKNGIPDLLAVKAGRTVFIEVKAIDGRVSPLQDYRMSELRKRRIETFVMYKPEDADPLCQT